MTSTKSNVALAITVDNLLDQLEEMAVTRRQQQVESSSSGSGDFTADWVRCSAHLYATTRMLVGANELKSIFFQGLQEVKRSSNNSGIGKKSTTPSEQLAHSLNTLRKHLAPTYAALDKWNTPATTVAVASATGQETSVVSGDGRNSAGGPATALTLQTPLSKEVLIEVLSQVQNIPRPIWFNIDVAPLPTTMMIHEGMEKGPWSKVVKQTGSLSGVKSSVEKGEVTTLGQLQCKLLHVANNSVMFNAPQSDYAPAARTFGMAVSHFFTQLCPPNPFPSNEELLIAATSTAPASGVQTSGSSEGRPTKKAKK